MSLEFIPNLLGVSDSVTNSLILAQRNGAHRVAIPYIGGNIFRSRIGVSDETLTDTIIESSLQSLGTLQVRFITHTPADTRRFQNRLQLLLQQPQFSVITQEQVHVVEGGITNFALHQCDFIVNAANMEVLFGDGISGVIGQATGQSHLVNQEAQQLIRLYNQRFLERYSQEGPSHL